MGGRVTECNFRYKGKKGWGTNLRIRTERKDSVRPLSLDRYGIHFLNGTATGKAAISAGMPIRTA